MEDKGIIDAKDPSLIFRYIDDVLSINNQNLFSRNLRLKYQQNSFRCFFSLLLHQIYTCGHLATRLYDNRDGLNFVIINFPHLDSNIPTRV